MLSKFDFYEVERTTVVSDEWRAGLERALASRLAPAGDIQFVEGGTLGICAFLVLEGRRRFMKTHLPHERCRANLAKEGELLAHLYGQSIGLEQVELTAMKDPQLCLLMDELKPLQAPMAPDEAWALATDVSRKLRTYPTAELTDFARLLDIGNLSLSELTQASQIDATLEAAVSFRLSRLGNALPWLEPAVCHGDFGPKNILFKEVPVMIDWEDAFYGIAGYDYLYWLSFMENRKFYPVALGRTPYGRPLEVDILTLVVVLKAALSVRSGDFRKHAMRIDARITEVLALDS